MSTTTQRLIGAGLFGAACLVTGDAGAIDRDEVLARAKAFAYHPWTASAANMTASCSAGYQSVYTPGDYMGLPYDWGGYMNLFQFDQQIASGYGAGSYPADGILSCTSGVDCSGFVSKAWDAGHWTTSSVHQTSGAINQSSLLVGDIFNDAGNHMAMFNYIAANGDLVLYESVGYNVHFSMPGWSWVDGYVPRRYNSISGTTAGNPLGTSTNPIPVSSFPFADSRDTTQAVSDVLDGCGASPSANEGGHEYIYAVEVTQPGTLSVMVQDDAGVDIDVHLYTSMNTNDCVARHDSAFSHPVDCGTYYVVADTFRGSQDYPGPYSLTIDLTPSGGACGNGPPSYDFEGQLGDDCAYPGNENLPFCNPNLDAFTCIYTASDSFCSKPCATSADCGDFSGGCCAEVSSGELYCLTAPLCGGEPPPGNDDPPPPPGDPNDDELPDDETVGVGGAGMGGAGTGGAATAPSQKDDDDEATASCTVSRSNRGSSSAAWLSLAAAGVALRRRRRG